MFNVVKYKMPSITLMVITEWISAMKINSCCGNWKWSTVYHFGFTFDYMVWKKREKEREHGIIVASCYVPPPT